MERQDLHRNVISQLEMESDCSREVRVHLKCCDVSILLAWKQTVFP